MEQVTSKRAKVNGITLHYVTAGNPSGPVVLALHGWPQNHREFLPIINAVGNEYWFIVPDLRGYADSDKPFSGYEPKTIAQDMLDLLEVEGVDRFHILSHDLGGPPSVALAYMAGDRAISLPTIETPFFGLDFPGYVDPRVPYWHLGMHMNMDITRFLVEGREEEYLRHFFRDFAYDPQAIPEEEVQRYVTQMKQPGNLRASLNHYGYIPQMAEQTAELAKEKLNVPSILAWGGATEEPLVWVALLRQRKGDLRQRKRRRDRSMWPLGVRRENRLRRARTEGILETHRWRTGMNSRTDTARERPFNITRVDHTGITVSSLQGSLDFWVDVLGFRHMYTWDFKNDAFIENLVGVEGASLSLAMVEGYGHQIELLQYHSPADRTMVKARASDAGFIHIAMYVDDLDAVLERIKEAGWHPIGPPQRVEGGVRDGLRLVYVRGPDGVTLEFLQAPTRS